MSVTRNSALHGIRVLDLTRVLAGPWCTQNLADLGADVIKIEKPGAGDDTRGWGPPFLCNAQGEPTSEAAYYLAANRNKRSVTLDIATERGAALVRQLARESDILVENFKVGGLKKYGLDYDSLRQENPRLIYCSITGFGQTGPYAKRPGYDFMIQGLGGLMSVTGEPDGSPGAGPQKAGVAVADLMTGMYATVGILAALQERHQSGLGQHIDMALLDCQVAMMANQNMNYLTTGKAPERMGNAHPNLVPYQVFEAADGYLIIAVGNDAQFAACCKVLEASDLASDVRFMRNRDRVANREALIPLLESIIRQKDRAHWLQQLETAGVQAGPINTLDDVYKDAQVQARALQQTLPHPVADVAPTVASPLRLSETPVKYWGAPPLLGQHTSEVLQEVLGLSDAEIQQLMTDAR